jgi:acetolactate synthase, large subunit (EC 2.2.1.6)
MIMPRAVDLLAREMERMGVDKVFGIIGGQIMPFFDALYNTNIKVYMFRHEQGAIHAADAYGRVTRRPMTVVVTSGPGATKPRHWACKRHDGFITLNSNNGPGPNSILR